ncbi:AAA-domain-containing protein [Pisolithus marmoratus]|nr:AAA-domain-containing protein [Pisolithus marmoratus]
MERRQLYRCSTTPLPFAFVDGRGSTGRDGPLERRRGRGRGGRGEDSHSQTRPNRGDKQRTPFSDDDDSDETSVNAFDESGSDHQTAPNAIPSSPPPGSEYHDSSEPIEQPDHHGQDEEEEEDEPVTFTQTSRGRRIKRAQYYESQSEEDRQDPTDLFSNDNHLVHSTRRSHQVDDDEDEDDQQPRRATRSQSSKRKTEFSDFIVSDEEESKDNLSDIFILPLRQSGNNTNVLLETHVVQQPNSTTAMWTQDLMARPRTQKGSLANAPRTSSDVGMDQDAEGEPDPDAEGELEAEQDGRPYALRRRTKINYAVPPPLEELKPPPPRNRNIGGRGGKKRGPGWSCFRGRTEQDSDVPLRTPRKNFGDGALLGAGAMSAGGLLPSDFAAATAGTPSNLGKIGESALADADPLGVNQNVTFDEVGGLDDHIHALKEMTLLPLLYPEVFQRFGLTPPRGVLFHGPPGTGKTLLARALAASTRSNGKGISFFMRKGADCLSKWVGEAERQLRLLFEEARTYQIHASIVSTLLALMDGMDGRGQVDPALRRPGRFDREFYFPLPTVEARERILGIMTRKWENWEGEKGAENVKGLARMTKGYGGADLRALCTEAALNAIQERYPQIYQSNDRLLLKPRTIGVSNSFPPLHAPLLHRHLPSPPTSPPSLEMPSSESNPRSIESTGVEEEAVGSWRRPSGRIGTGKRTRWREEMLMQSMETMRVYRPRVIIHGPAGMGQAHIGAAALYHLEGCHIQTLDLGTLMGDPTRTPEAAIVQLFVEAKRHPPSVIYIPALSSWCTAISETTRSTVRAMLESLSPTDPVLLLAVADGPLSSLPQDVKVWFGITRGSRIALDPTTSTSREAFFAPLIADIRRPPNAYPDGIARRKRVLEVLPLAPPPEPRQPSAAELALQVENDRKVMTVLKYRLGPILTELKRKFKRFTKRAREEYDFDTVVLPAATTATAAVDHPGGAGGVTEVEIVASNVVIQDMDGIVEVTNEKVVPNIITMMRIYMGDHRLCRWYRQFIPYCHKVRRRAQLQLLPPSSQPSSSQNQAQSSQIPQQGQPQPPQDEPDTSEQLPPQPQQPEPQPAVHQLPPTLRHGSRTDAPRSLQRQAAEMSVLEFDPQFAVECRRMAVRERKRREERKKEREKEKENGNGGEAEWECQWERHITDPLQLERRLSGHVPLARCRVGHLTRVLETTRTGSSRVLLLGSRNGHGRFANGGQPVQEDATSTFVSAEPPHQPRDYHPQRQHVVQNGLGPDAMIIDYHQSTSSSQDSVNPFLVASPIQPQPEKIPTMSISRLLNGDTRASSLSRNPTPTPSPLPLPQQQQQNNELPYRRPTPTTHSPPRTPNRWSCPRHHENPHVHLRPLPDFHVDEELVSTLQYQLTSKTDQFSVEMLEQLRAICLGCVWRHRKEWNRDALVREFMGVLDEYLDDAAADVGDALSAADASF